MDHSHASKAQHKCIKGCLPLLAEGVESVQEGYFLVNGNGHVILHCVQSSEDQVENAEGVAKPLWKLLDDHGKAAAT